MKYIFAALAFTSALTLSAQPDYRDEIETHREEYKADFKAEDYSPFYHEPKRMKKMRFYPADVAYVVISKVELTPDAKPFDISTYSGITKPFRQYAWLTFNLNGQAVKMAIYQSLNTIKIPAYKEYLFLPFKDITSGGKTYGGGRYLDFSISDIREGQLRLDFNKAYNPYCAYSDGYNCPIPPIENHLDMKIEAGEKMYKGKKMHRQ